MAQFKQKGRVSKNKINFGKVDFTNFYLSPWSTSSVAYFAIRVQYSIVKDSNADLTVGNWNSKKDP